jgi:hypothetical protein
MEEAFLAILLGTSGVTALVPASRINWGAHPQGTGSPYIVLNVISDAQGLVMNGPDNLSRGRVQVDCYAPSYPAAKAIARAIIPALHGYRSGGFRLVQHDATRDSREGGSNEAERLFRVSLDFTTNWRA